MNAIQPQHYLNTQSLYNADKDELNLLLNKETEADNSGNHSLLSRKTTESSTYNNNIEFSQLDSSQPLPSQWRDYYDKIVLLIEEIEKLRQEISKLSAERLQMVFGNSKDLEQKIQTKTHLALDKLKQCEQNLTMIDQKASFMSESESDAKIRQNLKRSMAIQIQELTVQLRGQQKKLFNGLTKYEQQEQKIEPVVAPWQTEEEAQQDNDLMIEYSKYRDEEINKLVESMNELAQIFKQLNNLVIDQGTLLDRIDFNLATTQKHIQQSNKHLTKAKEYMESPCARKVQQILIFLIIILTCILFLKYTL
ncbi:t-SNARE [Pseudocohnilembus persalinus]|uniref:t-SNARE n=1 Tax=Pseudocohnilembus persalinus TaxID=266149 RepID=A0A0V0QXX6_PSEPJ|nr:t-SNARE [Pseudocohnilembus persalinus]|eukprot:KRX07094.1 t-SNARE [Pseudocohnilembus persalinus]